MKRTTHKGSDEAVVDGQIAAEQRQPPELPIFDEEGWLILIDPAFHDRPQVAETFARRLFWLKEAIERGGEEGARRAVEALNEGIRLAYQYTAIHRAALRLFYLYLAGELVGDDPQELIDGAIESTIKRPDARQDWWPKDLS